MAKITIDGVEYEANPDHNLLQECLSRGLDLPYFCWHPSMGSVGACRQCAVKQYQDANDRDGTLVMACMTPATAGGIFSIEDAEARTMRARVIESLMISHPHDCPVCEEGGECHLQDVTLMSGHNYRRYNKNKVTHRNQYLGPFINHEMNRCIACYRCVRFYNDYAGGTDLAAQACHHHIYFGRHRDGVLESEFSGNLVEVCPTGVFTDKVFSRHYTRKWDLQSAPSICTGCAVGCNVTPGVRYRRLRRIVNRYNSEVNGYFICDRGRFGFDYVNSSERFSAPLQRDASGKLAALAAGPGGEAHDPAELQRQLAPFRDGQLIGIGSPRAGNESNFALRCLVGEDNFYSGMADVEQEAVSLILELARDPAFHSPGIREIEQCDAVLVLGEDLVNVAPRIALALRQSVRNKARELARDARIPEWQDAAVQVLAQQARSPLAILGSHAGRLDDIASDCLIDAPGALARIGFAIAARLSGQAPGVAVPGHEAAVERIAAQLGGARRPLVIAGASAAHLDLIKAAANVARALHETRAEQGRQGPPVDLCLVTPEANSMGVGMLAGRDAGKPPNPLSEALQKLASGAVSKAIVLENDLYRRAAAPAVRAALERVEHLLVIDHLPSPTTAHAHLLLPATAFSEQAATWVNYEGRAQLSFQVHRNPAAARPGWRWLNELAATSHAPHVEDWIGRCAAEARGFAGLETLLPDAGQLAAGMKIPRQTHRYSGRTAERSNVNVHEPKQATDEESVMAFSMEGVPSQRDASVLGAAWAPGWNSNQSITKFQDEVNGALRQGSTGTLLIGRDGNAGCWFAAKHHAGTAEQDDGHQRESDGALQVAFAYQIFGSEELSARSPAIRERMTGPWVAIAPDDAARLGLKQGDGVRLDGNGATATACIRTRIKPGTVAVYCADNRINPHSLGATVTLQKSPDAADGRGIAGLIASDLLEDYDATDGGRPA